MRFKLSLTLVLLTTPALLADAPSIPDEVRDKAASEWRKAYDQRIKHWTDQKELGKEKLRRAGTAADGRSLIKEADRELTAIKKDPYRLGIGPMIPLNPKPQSYGAAYPTSGKLLKAGKGEYLVEYRVITTELSGSQKLVKGRLLVKGDAPKGSAAGRDVTLSGLFYVVAVDADTATLLPIKLRPEELPK